MITKRVLVVEDDALNRALFCTVLEENGFEVQPVTDEREAVEAASQFDPHLIIMDIQLPHISGLKLIQTLKRSPRLSHVPVLAVTGYVGRGEERRVRRAGANDYLPKPVSIQPFMAAVERLVLREMTDAA